MPTLSTGSSASRGKSGPAFPKVSWSASGGPPARASSASASPSRSGLCSLARKGSARTTSSASRPSSCGRSTPSARCGRGRGRASPGRAPPSAGRCRGRTPALTSRDGQLVLRVLDPLLELPAVGIRLAALDALELRLRLLELAPRPLVVDLLRVDGVVHERERAILLDAEEARAGGERPHVPFAHVNARRSGLQHCDERRVPREDADL